MEIELRNIDDVFPYEDNPRITPERAIKAVMRSIEKYGWRQPIVVDEEGVIVVGHTRIFAAKRLGLEQVPVHVAVGLTPAQVKAYRIADNKTQELTSWDNEKLIEELTQLNSRMPENVTLEVPGFSDVELNRMIEVPADLPQKLTDPAEAMAEASAGPSPAEELPDGKKPKDPSDTKGRGRGTDTSQVPEDADPKNVRLVACPRCFHRFQIELKPAWERKDEESTEESGEETAE